MKGKKRADKGKININDIVLVENQAAPIDPLQDHPTSASLMATDQKVKAHKKKKKHNMKRLIAMFFGQKFAHRPSTPSVDFFCTWIRTYPFGIYKAL